MYIVPIPSAIFTKVDAKRAAKARAGMLEEDTMRGRDLGIGSAIEGRC